MTDPEHRAAILFSLIFLLSACAAEPRQPGTTTIEETDTQLGQASNDGCLPQIIQLSDNEVSNFKWREDNQAIYYQQAENWFQVDLVTQQVTHTEQQPWLATPTTPSFVIKFQEEFNAVPPLIVSISPSGEKALAITYFSTAPALAVTQTASEGEGGGSPYEVIRDVYLVNISGDQKFIGSFSGLTGQIAWPLSEEYVVIEMLGRSPVPLGEAIIWLAELKELEIRYLYPVDEHAEFTYFWSISPNSRYILFSVRGTMHVFDTKTDMDQALNLMAEKFIGWLMNSNELVLVGTNNQTSLATDSAYIYNIETRKLNLLTELGFNVTSFLPTAIQLSPDKSHLAFLKENTGELFVLDLCME